jgi:hypothetical protein
MAKLAKPMPMNHAVNNAKIGQIKAAGFEFFRTKDNTIIIKPTTMA